jgi:hypothetical protein
MWAAAHWGSTPRNGVSGSAACGPVSLPRDAAAEQEPKPVVSEAAEAEWSLQRVASPGLLVEGGLGRRQDGHQALLDCGHHASGHLRGGVPIVGPDGAGLLPAGPPAGLVAHQLIDDPGRDAAIFQPGGEGVAEVVGAVQVDRMQQGMLGCRPERPLSRLGSAVAAPAAASSASVWLMVATLAVRPWILSWAASCSAVSVRGHGAPQDPAAVGRRWDPIGLVRAVYLAAVAWAIYLAIGIATLRHRLYDIDRLISAPEWAGQSSTPHPWQPCGRRATASPGCNRFDEGAITSTGLFLVSHAKRMLPPLLRGGDDLGRLTLS